MKRYDVVLGRSGGRPHARCDETPEGAYVRHYVAQKVIDALKAANADLLAALENMVAWSGKRGGDDDALLPADQQDQEVAQAMRAIAKAKGETK